MPVRRLAAAPGLLMALLIAVLAALGLGAPQSMAQTPISAVGFAAEGVWMYQPKDGETVELAVAVDKPLRLFFKGPVVVTEVRRSQEMDLAWSVNMVEIRANNRKRGDATMTVKGGDGRLITVQIQVADTRNRPASPEIVTIR